MLSQRHDLNGEDTRTSAESSYTQLRVQDYSTAQHKNCPSSAFDDRPDRYLFRVLKRSPFLNHTHLIFARWEGKKKHDRTTSALEVPCCSHYGECLARLKQVLIFKVLVRSGGHTTHQTRSERSIPLGPTSNQY